MHAGGVARHVDFGRPLVAVAGAAARRGRCRRCEVAAAALGNVVVVVIVVVIDGYFENSFGRYNIENRNGRVNVRVGDLPISLLTH